MAQSIITQVSKENDSYTPCPAPDTGLWKKFFVLLLHSFLKCLQCYLLFSSLAAILTVLNTQNTCLQPTPE